MIPIVLALSLAADVPMTTIARGSASGQETARQVVVRTTAEWQDVWRNHAPGQKPPVVDFSSSMVVGVFLGTQPSAGIDVEIVAVRPEGEGLVVEYTRHAPSRGMMAAQILTEPFHLVSVPKRDGPVRFVERSSSGP
jgi:hypothetical protein